jgi:hypothetical protein
MTHHQTGRTLLVFRRLLVGVTAATLLAGVGLVATPADAARRQSFIFTASGPGCSVCSPPITRAQGDPLTVSGYTISRATRPYVIQELSGGAWRVVGKRRTLRHGSTSFVTFTRSTTGHYSIRAVALRYHGLRRLTSKTISWTVLTRTTVTASYSANPAPVNSSFTVSGGFTPPSARYVSIITGAPKVGAVSGWSMRSNPDGSFAISVPTGGPAYTNFRVLVERTATEAEVSMWLGYLRVA